MEKASCYQVEIPSAGWHEGTWHVTWPQSQVNCGLNMPISRRTRGPALFLPVLDRSERRRIHFAAAPNSYLSSPVPQVQMPWPLPSCFIMEHSVDRTAACAVLSALVAKSDSVT